MPLIKQISVPDGLIGLFRVDETYNELNDWYNNVFGTTACCPEGKHERRKREWLSVRIAISELIGSDFLISYNENGAPLLEHPVFRYISISHSERYIAVYLHQNKTVGIDVEKDDRNFLAVERKYLSEKELEVVAENPALRSIFWCCKEAVYKLSGSSGVDFRKQIELEIPDAENYIQAYFIEQNVRSVRLSCCCFDGHVLVYSV